MTQHNTGAKGWEILAFEDVKLPLLMDLSYLLPAGHVISIHHLMERLSFNWTVLIDCEQTRTSAQSLITTFLAHALESYCS